MNPVRAYVATQQNTASKERLMLLLFETALRHIRTGAAALDAGKNQTAVSPLTKAADIVDYLQATLDARRAPDLCENLNEVYTFVTARLLLARTGYDAAAARDAERVFAPVVAAFTGAVTAVERGQAG